MPETEIKDGITVQELDAVLRCVDTVSAIVNKEAITAGNINDVLSAKTWLETVRKGVCQELSSRQSGQTS